MDKDSQTSLSVRVATFNRAAIDLAIAGTSNSDTSFSTIFAIGPAGLCIIDNGRGTGTPCTS